MTDADPGPDDRRAELARRISADLEPLTPIEPEVLEGEVLDAEPPPKTGLFQLGPQMPTPWKRPEPPLPDDLPDDPAERMMAILMLRAARFAPRHGRIRFQAIDRTETGSQVVREATISTEDARRLTGLDSDDG